MNRLPPVFVIAVGLVMLSCAIVLMGDFFFSYLPDPVAQTELERRRVADSLAVPLVDLLSRGQLDQISVVLNGVASQDSDIQSVGIRRSDGQLFMATIGHVDYWAAAAQQSSARVPISTAAGPWGVIEFAFVSPKTGWLAFLNQSPALKLSLVIGVVGLITYGLYMRRVLQNFDPSTVIPERISAAFDAMTQGVVIVDARGRVALSNKKAQQMLSEQSDGLVGRDLSAVQWLKTRLPESHREHPWFRSMHTQSHVIGAELLTMKSQKKGLSHVVVNCAPIIDHKKVLRGCMITFDDLTDLHNANQRLERSLVELESSRSEVEKKASELARIADIDYLTGLLNRRAFARDGAQAFDALRDRRHSLSCLMIDIDHFKAVNDSFGHAVGDEVIKMVAKILTVNTREGDIVGRFGGEEFCIVLPNTGIREATELGERIRNHVEQSVCRGVSELGGKVITSSVGATAWTHQYESLEQLIDSADQALYQAKETGRNRVCVAPLTTDLKTPAQGAPSTDYQIADLD